MTTSAWTDDPAASPTTHTGLVSYVSGAAGRLILISFLSLYLELTFIRWAPMQVRLLAYFSNYVLIAALLGLGLGMMLADKSRRLLVYFPAALTIMVVAVLILERSDFVVPLVAEGQFIWNYLAGIKASGLLAYAVLVGFFLAVAGLFALDRPGSRSSAAAVRLVEGLLAQHCRQPARCRRVRGGELHGGATTGLVRRGRRRSARVHVEC